MKNPEQILLKPSDTILKSMAVIDGAALQIALVVDADMHLLGTVTDGDIRRALLKGVTFEDKISTIMNSKPSITGEETSAEEARHIMRLKVIHQLPVIDKNGRLVGLHLDTDVVNKIFENEVVLMAGGFGKRLESLTENCPKPMLKIGTKPILETIIDSFVEAGFYKFTISLGYLPEVITNYFGDGSKRGIQIKYVQEAEPLGTAGALSLLSEKPKMSFIVMNGDLLTRVDLKNLLKFHEEQKSLATMCVRGFEHNIPYGVVKTEGHSITQLEEKPIQSVLVNAGIYVLDPKCMEYIPKNEFYNMTSLFEKLIAKGKKPAAFPIHEYWIDIGQPHEFNKADTDYAQIFGKTS